MQSARTSAANFARKSYAATLGADSAEFTQEITNASRQGQDFAREAYEATVGSDIRPFVRGLGEATLLGRRFDGEEYEATATVRGDTSPARRALDGFDEVFRRYGRSWGQQGIRTRVTADIRRAQTQLRLLERTLEGVVDEDRRIRIEADILRTRQRLEGLGHLADSLGLKNPTMSVSLRGAASTYAQMFGLTRLADRLDGYNIRMGADIDSSLSNALPNLLGALEVQLLRYKTVTLAAAVATTPAFFAALGSIPAVAAGAAGAVGSLAISISRGLVGALGSVAGAAGLAAGAITGYGAAVLQARDYAFRLNDIISQQTSDLSSAGDAVAAAREELKKAQRGTEEYARAQRALALAQQNQRHEQEELNALLQTATPRILRLSDAGHRLTLQWIAMKGAIANELAPAMTGWIQDAVSWLPRLRPHILGMVSDMTGVTDSFVQAAQKGQNLRSIQTILSGIKAAGVPALQLVGNTALFAVNMLSPIVPASLAVLKNLRGLSAEASRWAASAEGQRDIGTAWDELTSRGQKLYRIALNLGAGLWGVARALDASGTGDWLLNQIVRLSREFRTNMRVGGEWRNAITGFMEDFRPVLRAVGPLLKSVARNALELIDAVMNTRQPNGQRTLVAVINSLTKSVGPLFGLLRHEFRTIAPLLPGIIEDMSEWFSTFAAATPEMRTFIRLFGRALDLFTDLPKKQQIAIARTLAYVSAFKALGGGAAVSALGTLTQTVAQYALMSRILRRMPKAPVTPQTATTLPKSFGGPVPVQTVPATGPAVKRTWATRLASFARTLAGVTILATLVLTYDYGKAKKVYEQARKDGKGIGLAAGQAYVNGFKGVPIVGDLLAPLIDKLNKQINQNKGKGGRLSAVGHGIMSGIVAGLSASTPGIGPALSGFLNSLLKWWGIKSPSTKAANRIGKPIAQGILQGFKDVPVVGPIVEFFSRFFGKSKGEADKKKWKPIGSGAAGDVLKGFTTGGLVGGAVALIQAWFNRSKEKQEDQAWKPLGSSAAGAILKGFLTGGLIGGAVALIGNWFKRSKEKRDSQNWKPLGSSAAGAIAKGFATGGLIGAAVALIGRWFDKVKNERDHQKWYSIGRDSGEGIIRGWNAVNFIKAFVNKVKGAYNAVKEWIQSHSPSRRFMALGRDTALGFAQGLLNDSGMIVKNARAMAQKVAAAIRDGIVNLGEVPMPIWDQLLKRGWKGRAGDSAERLYAPQGARRSHAGMVQAEDGSWVPKSFYSGGRATPGMSRATRDGIVNLGEVSRRTWEKLLSQGWKGRAGDNAERLYAPHRAGMVQAEDGSWVPKSFYGSGGSHRGMVQAEDGSWVPKSFYSGGGRRAGMVQAEDGSWVPRSFYSGHKPMSEEGMRNAVREGMREHGRESRGGLAQEIAQAVVMALRSDAYEGYLDRSIGGYFGHRNAAGADPR